MGFERLKSTFHYQIKDTAVSDNESKIVTQQEPILQNLHIHHPFTIKSLIEKRQHEIIN